MSQKNPAPEENFCLFSDVTEFTNLSSVGIGYVIKHDNEPPLMGSFVYNGSRPYTLEVQDENDCQKTHLVKYTDLHNSYGEIVAAIEGLDTLLVYCQGQNIDPKDCTVDFKTDFKELKLLMNDSISVKDVEEINGKKALFIRLKAVKDEFKDVRCDVVRGSTNIAHRRCELGMQEYIKKEVEEIVQKLGQLEEEDQLIENDNESPKKNFYKIYENPDLCILQ